MEEQQNFATYSQSPSQVIDAVTAALVQRSALSAELAPGLGTSLVDAYQEQRRAQLNSESVALSHDDLAGLVSEDYRRFIGEQGGRYVVTLTLEPALDGGVRVTVNPTLIATVGGGEGPLGGRPLPSNGTIESAILQAITGRLGR